MEDAFRREHQNIEIDMRSKRRELLDEDWSEVSRDLTEAKQRLNLAMHSRESTDEFLESWQEMVSDLNHDLDNTSDGLYAQGI